VKSRRRGNYTSHWIVCGSIFGALDQTQTRGETCCKGHHIPVIGSEQRIMREVYQGSWVISLIQSKVDCIHRSHHEMCVITKILSANGYKNPTSSNSYEVTHGPKLQQKNFQKVQNYTTSDKIKVHYYYTGRTRTCTIQKRRKSAHVHDV
jgi:hypothetical protein